MNLISGAAIRCTAADETRAVLIVRPELAEPLPIGATLTGVVRGPYSQQAHTLPAEFKLEPTSDDALRATVIDPCYSTDDLAMEYEIELVVNQNEARICTHTTRVELSKRAG